MRRTTRWLFFWLRLATLAAAWTNDDTRTDHPAGTRFRIVQDGDCGWYIVMIRNGKLTLWHMGRLWDRTPACGETWPRYALEERDCHEAVLEFKRTYAIDDRMQPYCKVAEDVSAQTRPDEATLPTMQLNVDSLCEVNRQAVASCSGFLFVIYNAAVRKAFCPIQHGLAPLEIPGHRLVDFVRDCKCGAADYSCEVTALYLENGHYDILRTEHNTFLDLAEWENVLQNKLNARDDARSRYINFMRGGADMKQSGAKRMKGGSQGGGGGRRTGK